jgi:type IV secretion system protein VirB1
VAVIESDAFHRRIHRGLTSTTFPALTASAFDQKSRLPPPTDMDFAALASSCAPLVHPSTARALVSVESAFDPLAIGVNGGALLHQPRTLAEAIATARRLRRDGWSFDVGLAQINVGNWERLGLTLESAFDPCANLRAMQAVLVDCFAQAKRRNAGNQVALRHALHCYNAGPFAGGPSGYAQRVVRAAIHP